MLELISALTNRATHLLNERYEDEWALRKDTVQAVLCGRKASEMGGIIEHEWRNRVNKLLAESSYELAWMPGHSYNDAVILEREVIWNSETRHGEVARYECKTLNVDSDEAKAHFDPLIDELHDSDALLVFTWHWKPLNASRVCPHIDDFFIGQAKEIAKLRDVLHLARGGSFVHRDSCPDGCTPSECPHHGEPLNANGKRERITGPETRRPKKVAYAANFGGLVRMLKARKSTTRALLAEYLKANPAASEFVGFMERNRLVSAR